MPEEKRYIKVQEASERLGVTPNAVIKMLQKGDLEGIPPTQYWQVDEISLNALLENPIKKGRPSNVPIGDSMLENIQMAARTAARIGLAPNLSNYGINRLFENIFYAVEHNPKDLDGALDIARGMLVTDLKMNEWRMVDAKPVFETFKVAIGTEINKFLSRKRSLMSVWKLTYLSEIWVIADEKGTTQEG